MEVFTNLPNLCAYFFLNTGLEPCAVGLPMSCTPQCTTFTLHFELREFNSSSSLKIYVKGVWTYCYNSVNDN